MRIPIVPLTARLSAPLLALAAAVPATAQTPIQDTSFPEGTPATDQDLVIVREKAYGAGGIDLSSIGIGGTHDFVQSIYVRARHGTPGVSHVTRGRIVLPPNVTVLGIIIDETSLGGSADDQAWTAADDLFAIGGDPDRYSAPRRGSEQFFHAEHVVLRSNGTVDFYLYQQQDDLDDFRIIIDYGSSFPASESFGVELHVDESAMNLKSEFGVQVGDGAGGVPGAVTFSSAKGLDRIPLVGTMPPVPNAGLRIDPYDAIIMRRTPSFGEQGALEWFDLTEETLAIQARSGPRIDLEPGPFGRLYGIELNFTGFVTFDLQSGSEGFVRITGLPTWARPPRSLAHIPGTDTLFVASQSGLNNSTTFHVVDARSGAALESWEEPVPYSDQFMAAAVIGQKGYVQLLGGGVIEVDLVTGARQLFDIGISGSYFDMKALPGGTSILSLFRSPGTLTGNVAELDPTNGTVVSRVAADQDIVRARGMVVDGNGLLWVNRQGFGSQIPTALTAYDTNTWQKVRSIPQSSSQQSDELAIAPAPARFDVPYCSQVLRNTSNLVSWIAAYGSPVVADQDLELRAYNLPGQQFGIFINGSGPDFIPSPGVAYNNLCVGPSIGRFNGQVFQADLWGTASIQVNLNAMPTANGPVTVLPGDTYTFQAWHRQGGVSAGFTDAISITFQ